ncbi:sigma-54 dependent transcriptional regulator [bacterium]|nr:sigma-54 dependent transcriptional regulator [bacterium]
MKQFQRFLLEIWQEAARHIEIAESASRIAPIVANRLSHSSLIVRATSPDGGALETVASVASDGAQVEVEARDDLHPSDLRALIEGRRARTSPAPVEFAGRYAGLLSGSGTGRPAMAGPLLLDGQFCGILILHGLQGAVFDHADEEVFGALLEPLAAALGNDRRLRELRQLREAAEADRRSLLRRLGRESLSVQIVGEQGGFRMVMERVDQVGQTNAPVLLLGETGTGKEVVARAIHERSRRARGPFLRVNCGAISSELIDSELFGHERGAFTGASNARMGWFERADGGTLFLDEVGELPPGAQVRMLRVLQDGIFERVGAQQSKQVDVRIVAATNRDLSNMVRHGTFREDLWYRLAVFPIYLPPLRERAEDLYPLACHFARRASERLGLSLHEPTQQDMRILSRYDWPGNIRELSSVIERAAILGEGRGLEIARALGRGMTAQASPLRTQARSREREGEEGLSTLEDATRLHIEKALELTQGRVDGPNGAAKLLSVNPNTLRSRMRKLRIDRKDFIGIERSRNIEHR